jgi:hypothetical protein
MAKNGTVRNVVNKSKRIVGDVASGVVKFVGNIVPKSLKRGGKSRKTRKTRKSRKSRKN